MLPQLSHYPKTTAENAATTAGSAFRYGSLANMMALGASLIALLALLGWTTQLLFLVQGATGLAAMVPSTAILVLGCAATLWHRGPQGLPVLSRPLRLAVLASMLLLITTEVTLFYAQGSALEEFIITGFEPSDKLRMSNATALCGAIFCIGRGVTATGMTRADVSAKWLALTGAMIASVSAIAHLFNAQALYQVFLFKAMSLPTSIAFVLLFVGLGIIQPATSWYENLLGKAPASRRLRKIIVPATVTPIVLGKLVLGLAEQSSLPEQFRLSIVATLMSGLILFGLFLLAARENEAELVRSKLIADLERTVGDRDMLLAEVYHRVKNNLAQINALLRIQADISSSPDVKSALTWATGRVDAIGTVQHLLMSSPKRDHLSIKDFLEESSENAMLGMGADLNNIMLTTDIDDMIIDIDTATTIGLLVNELFSNIAKHAFDGQLLSDEAPGTIFLGFKPGKNEHTLIVRDNGKGLPEGESGLPPTGSGSVIIGALVQQLRGRLEYNSKDGLETCIVFKG